MVESTPTRDRIVAAMAHLMRSQGYGATSVKHLVDAAQAPIGSVYHFFPGGKRQLAKEALVASGATYLDLVALLMDPHDDLGDAIRALFSAAAEDIERAGWASMCPVGSVGGEIADVEPELRLICAGIVTSWIEQASGYFVGRGLEPADARELTLAALSALEGAFLIARITRSPEALHAAGRTVASRAERMTRKTQPPSRLDPAPRRSR